MTTKPSIKTYTEHQSWPERYRLLMAWGKEAELTEAEKTDLNAIKQCSAGTWLVLRTSPTGHYFAVESESKLVTGLGRMLLAELAPQAELNLESDIISQLMQQTALNKHLSASRANGVRKILERAIELLREHQKQTPHD